MSEERSDVTEKANNILQELKNKGCNFYFASSELREVGEIFSTVVFEFMYKNKNDGEKIFKIPVIFENKEYSKNFIKVLESIKVSLLFNISGVVPVEAKSEVKKYEKKGTITPNQKRLLYDKLKKNNLKSIVEERIKSLGLDSIEELSKEDASGIIDIFQKK